MSLFKPFEERPPFCQAVNIWFDTIGAIADYYAVGRYKVDHHRDADGHVLTISHAGAKDSEEPFQLVIKLPYSAQYAPEPDDKPFRRQVLVYGHPPTVEFDDEFYVRWRAVPEGTDP